MPICLTASDIGTFVDKGLQIRTKPYGLAYTPVALGLQLTLAFPFCFLLSDSLWKTNRHTKAIIRYGCSCLFLSVAIFANLRSAQLALIAQMIFLPYFMPIAKSREVVKIRIRAFLLIPVLTVMLLVVVQRCYWFFMKYKNAWVRSHY